MLDFSTTKAKHPRPFSAINAPKLSWILAFVAKHLRTLMRIAAASALLAGAGMTFAQVQSPPLPPATPEVEARLKKLETELRCLVCQNQTLAESPAGLAGDLRREIRLLADSGKSNDEIKVFLKDRYGDFVLYKPPVSSKTYLLWFGPFLLLFAGGIIALLMARSRKARSLQTASTPTISDAELKRAEALLKE
jgi:cytochrome c-type biogenesis protein CcmH